MPPVSQSAPIGLDRVRALFSRPGRVRESNFLRREIASRMLERLDLVKIAPKVVLDAGCGEGADLSLLQQRFLAAHVNGLDAAPAMLGLAAQAQQAGRSSINQLFRRLLPGRRSQIRQGLIAGNFADLPFARQALDLVWSNLALHWHPQPDKVFAEWRRALAVDGLLMFSCFGPDTFKELRTAFAAVDQGARVLPFVDMHDLGDMLVEAGFSAPVMDMETITVTYESVARLLADVRAWGGNPLSTRSRGLMGRNKVKALAAALQSLQMPDGRIPLSFEIIYGHAFRPAAKLTAAGENIIRFTPPSQ